MYIKSKSSVVRHLKYLTFIQDITEGIDGSVSSYTFNFTFSNAESDSILITVSTTSCKSGVCTLEVKSIFCCFSESSAEVIVTAFASNLLGDGLPSDAIHIDLGIYVYSELYDHVFL